MGGRGSKDKSAFLVKSIADHAKDINCMALSEDQSVLVTGSEDCTAKMYDLKDKDYECLGTFEGHTSYITCITIADTFTFTGSNDTTIRKWDMTTCLCVMEEHDAPVMNLLIVNRLMYSCSQDCTARCWVREFGDCTNVYRDATDSLVVIHVKNGLLFTAGGDSVIRVYDIKSGALKETFEGHSASVQCLAIAGNRMYTAGYDNTLKIWNIESLRMEKNSMLDDEDLEGLPLHNHQPLLNNRINKYDDVDVNSAPAM
ncbi:hypothetical protein HAZT_HAZT001851, partial [Hyalella azteca]